MTKGFILAAGIGSRLKPWTNHHPKALVPVHGTPMLERVINNMKRAGINDITINVHHFADQIEEFVQSNDSFGLNIRFSNERPTLLDTGGGLIKAFPIIGDFSSLLIHNADIYTDLALTQLIDVHHKAHSDVTLLTSRRPSSRQLLFNPTTVTLKGWINHNTGETLGIDSNNIGQYEALSFNGIHIISPIVLDWLESNVKEQQFSIIPQYIAMSQSLKILGYTPPDNYTWVDVGKPASLAQLESTKAL